MQASKNFPIMMSADRARLLSVVAIASLAAGYLGAAFLGEAAQAAELALSALKLVGLFSTLALFLSSYGQLSQRRESELDEREAQIRNRAYVLTHQIMVACLFLAFFYTELGQRKGWWLPAIHVVPDLITAFALASLALPGAILAWRDRDLSDDG